MLSHLRATVIVGLLLATSSAFAGWTLVTGTDDEQTLVSVDFSTVKRLPGNRVRAWVFWQYRHNVAKTGKPVLAIKNLSIVNCTDESIEDLATLGYGTPEGDGPTVLTDKKVDAPSNFEYMAPETMGLHVVKSLCARGGAASAPTKKR